MYPFVVVLKEELVVVAVEREGSAGFLVFILSAEPVESVRLVGSVGLVGRIGSVELVRSG
jgi:hypothetical protein